MTHPAPPNISPTCKEFRMSTLFVSTGNGGVQYCLIHWKGRWELNCTKINKEEPASTRPWSTTSTPLTQNYNWPKLVLIWISLDVILFCYMISGITFISIFLIDVLLKAYLKKSQVNIEDRLIDHWGMKFYVGNFQILGADSEVFLFRSDSKQILSVDCYLK